MTKKQWVQCIVCDKIDAPARGNVGTRTTMICKDCCMPNISNNAAMCRACCETEHGTKWTESS